MKPNEKKICFRVSAILFLFFFGLFLGCALDVHNFIKASDVTSRVLWAGLWSALGAIFLLASFAFGGKNE